MSSRSPLVVRATDVIKRYAGRPVFKPVTFEVSGGVWAITGQNGAGKSTLIKIIANVLSPTKGSCSWHEGSDRALEHDLLRTRMGFVAPYLELYDELTALEHLQLVGRLKGKSVSDDEALSLLSELGLDDRIARGDRHLRAYSSGMKQRVRCAMALVCTPDILLFDEPTSNLDEDGTERLLAAVRAAADRGATVFLATNDARERSIATAGEIRIEPHTA